MSLRRFLSTNHSTEADQSYLEDGRQPAYSSNVTTALSHTLSGRDSVNNETKSTLTDTLGVAETSEVATPKYSKCQSGKFKFSPLLICVNFVSLLPDLC